MHILGFSILRFKDSGEGLHLHTARHQLARRPLFSLGMNEIFSADLELHVKSFGAFSTNFYSLFYLSIRHFPSSETNSWKPYNHRK